MDFKFLLLSFDGRIRRLHYWLAGIGCGFVGGILFNILLMTSGFPLHGPNPISGILCLAVFVALMWISIALGIKRCHDRDKSGLFLLVSLIPLVQIWVLVELGFLDGTPGPNKYGPSPKGIGAPAAA
jgi:uncharacterized membrane protein YhaH (DUF805 family)